jgi:hypothetical protein
MAAVLRGTKLPAWSCNCGQGGNWASRIKCRAEDCGKAAPSRIIGRAKAADAAARSEGKPDGPGRRQPERAGESSKEAKELKELRKEVAALKKAAKEPDVSEANDTEAPGPTLASLLAMRATALKEGFKEGDPILGHYDERIAKARLARDSGKSISTRMADSEKLVARKKKLHEAATQELQEHLDATAALRQDVDETAAAVVQAETQLRDLHSEALLAPGQSEILPGAAMAGLESMAAGNTAAEALLAELRKVLAAQPAVEGRAGLGTAAPEAVEIDDEDDAIMGQLEDFEAAADELAAQCSTSTGGTTEAKKKMVSALAAFKASKASKKKKGGLVVQQQSK